MRTKEKFPGMLAGLAAVLTVVFLTACRQKDGSTADTQPADTTLTKQITEETSAVEALSHEEWVKPFVLDKEIFLIFHDTTGRKNDIRRWTKICTY